MELDEVRPFVRYLNSLKHGRSLFVFLVLVLVFGFCFFFSFLDVQKRNV